MKEPWAAILLAGAIERSPLARQLDLPAICLPMRRQRTLLETWVALFREVDHCTSMRVVMSTQREAEQVRSTANGELASVEHLSIHADPAPWRGTAGLVHDIAMHLDDDHWVLIVEANCLPPASLKPLFDGVDESLDGVVGITAANEPAGVYLMRKRLLGQVRDVGFVDLKEQFLPQVYISGGRLQAVRITDNLLRLRSRSTYLNAVRQSEAFENTSSLNGSSTNGDSDSEACRVYGACRVDKTAHVSRDAIIYNSVILDGAVVEPGAIVSRCVVSSHARVPAHSRNIDQIVGRQTFGKRNSISPHRVEPNANGLDSQPTQAKVAT